VLLLQQSPVNALSLLDPATALTQLAMRSFLPYWDTALMERALNVLERLIATRPVYLLQCRPEPTVIPMVRAVL